MEHDGAVTSVVLTRTLVYKCAMANWQQFGDIDVLKWSVCSFKALVQSCPADSTDFSLKWLIEFTSTKLETTSSCRVCVLNTFVRNHNCTIFAFWIATFLTFGKENTSRTVRSIISFKTSERQKLTGAFSDFHFSLSLFVFIKDQQSKWLFS